MTAIRVDRAPGETRAVATDGAGRLLDLAIERPGGPPDIDDLFAGRVVARVPALAGAFVALGRGSDGFLPDSAGGRDASEGALLAVRVTRSPQGGKGPRLARADAVAAGQGRIAPGPGAEARLRALHPDATAAGWTESIEEQVAALAEPEAALPGGGRLSIHPTPALVALDVDLAGGAAGTDTKRRAHAANTRFVPEIFRQIRLRHLGGAVVIDIAGLPIRARAALGETFQQAAAADPLGARFLGFSGLGLAEILRPRRHAPLHELLAGPHAAALAAGRALLRAAVPPFPRHTLRMAPSVLGAWEEDAVLRGALRDALGYAVTLRADPGLGGVGWRLDPA